MMLSGATKTLTAKATQTQPTRMTRLWPAESSIVRRRMTPNTPTFSSSRIFAVNSCVACTRTCQLMVYADDTLQLLASDVYN